MSDELKAKKRCWDDILKQFFKGPEDPGYVVLKVTPTLIECMASGAMASEIYNP